MMKRKMLSIAVSLVVLASFVAAAAFAQGPSAGKDMQKVVLKGKIGYQENAGGFYIIGENPPAKVFIVNQDKKLLEKLKLKGKQLTIEGHYTISADQLVVEKIDGKAYTGGKKPAVK